MADEDPISPPPQGTSSPPPKPRPQESIPSPSTSPSKTTITTESTNTSTSIPTPHPRAKPPAGPPPDKTAASPLLTPDKTPVGGSPPTMHIDATGVGSDSDSETEVVFCMSPRVTRYSLEDIKRDQISSQPTPQFQDFSELEVEEWFNTYKNGKYKSYYDSFRGLDGDEMALLSESQFQTRAGDKGDVLYNAIKRELNQEGSKIKRATIAQTTTVNDRRNTDRLMRQPRFKHKRAMSHDPTQSAEYLGRRALASPPLEPMIENINETPSITSANFQLWNCGVGLSFNELHRRPASHYQMIVDHNQRMIRFVSRQFDQSFHFSTFTVVITGMDKRYFSLECRECNIGCYTHHDTQRDVIVDELNKFIGKKAAEWRPTDLLWCGSILKKGSKTVTWKPRWISVDARHFTVYRKKPKDETEKPIYVISIRPPTKIEKYNTKSGNKFTLNTPSSNFVFKTRSKFERNVMIHLLMSHRSGYQQQQQDHQQQQVDLLRTSFDSESGDDSEVERLVTKGQQKHVPLVPKIDEHEADGDEEYKQPSTELYRGVYQLTEQLLTSMHTGAYVTESIYVCQDVWLQEVKLVGLEQKITIFESLRGKLHQLYIDVDIVRDSSESVEAGLVQFRLGAEEVQNKLAKHFNFIHSCKQSVADCCRKKKRLFGKKIASLGKSISRAASHKSASKDNRGYVDLIKACLEYSNLFGRWGQELDTNKSIAKKFGEESMEVIVEHLHYISDFIYSVLCNIIIRDLKALIKKFMKKRSHVDITDVVQPGDTSDVPAKELNDRLETGSTPTSPDRRPAAASPSPRNLPQKPQRSRSAY